MQVTNPVTAQDSTYTPAAASSQSSNDTSASNSALSGLANESTFLQLLVSQIKNQDPLNPTDSVQFLGQLTSLSQLEQLVGIKQDLDPVSTSSSANSNSTSTNSTTNN